MHLIRFDVVCRWQTKWQVRNSKAPAAEDNGRAESVTDKCGDSFFVLVDFGNFGFRSFLF